MKTKDKKIITIILKPKKPLTIDEYNKLLSELRKMKNNKEYDTEFIKSISKQLGIGNKKNILCDPIFNNINKCNIKKDLSNQSGGVKWGIFDFFGACLRPTNADVVEPTIISSANRRQITAYNRTNRVVPAPTIIINNRVVDELIPPTIYIHTLVMNEEGKLLNKTLIFENPTPKSSPSKEKSQSKEIMLGTRIPTPTKSNTKSKQPSPSSSSRSESRTGDPWLNGPRY
jgi:hypothetical protein